MKGWHGSATAGSCCSTDPQSSQPAPRLGLALQGNTFVRKVHANFNPAVTDAGALAMEVALPGCSVAAVWMDNCGVGAEANARLQWRCVINSVRLVALNASLLTSISLNLVGLPHAVEHNVELLAAAHAQGPQWSMEGAAIEPPEWAEESCDTAVTGALADALSANTTLTSISLMMNRELSPTAAAYFDFAFVRSSVQTRTITYLPTAAREAREAAGIAARKALREKQEKERAGKEREEKEAATKKSSGGRRATPRGSARTPSKELRL